jgi:hypothetical protein
VNSVLLRFRCASFAAWVGPVECPGWCGLLTLAHPPGQLKWTDPPLVDLRALTFVSISLHRPSRHLERCRGGRCRFSDTAPVTRRRTVLSPNHADPVARAIKFWCQSELSSLRPVGVAPDPPAPHHCSVSSARPEGRPSVRSASLTHPVSRAIQQVSVFVGHPCGCATTRSDSTPPQLPASMPTLRCPPFTRRCSANPV